MRTLVLYPIYIFDKYKSLLETKNSEEINNFDLALIFEWYCAINLSEETGREFFCYTDIDANFKEDNQMSIRDTGIDLSDMKDTIVQCKLRSSSLSYTEVTTFFASQVIYDDTLKTNIIRWKQLIITRNNDCKLSSNLQNKSKQFIDKTFSIADLKTYCNNLINNPPERPLPEQNNLELRDYQNEAVNIILKNNSSIVVKGGDLEINGFNNSKISVSEDSESFIYVENSNNTRIFNTQFQGFKSLEKNNWILPSAITFYQSKVLIENSVFKNNKRGDDMINFFRCPSVKVINSKFENILNDAIDSDFSVVEVNNSEFHNIGNDAIDGSGSDVTISYSNFGYVGDKAISAGEKSMFKSIGNKFQNNELGLTIKDGSILSSEFDEFQNNTIDLVMFTKKRIYGKPSVSLNMSNVSSNLIESDIKIENGDFKIRYSKKVEKLLYGEVYGKATK